MSSRKQPAPTPAFAALHRAGVEAIAHHVSHDPHSGRSYGAEAAAALGVPAGRVFKTLLIQLSAELAVAIVPVDRTLNLKAAALALGGKKARLADPDAAERATGYVVGGISPFGQRRQHRTVVDDSVLRWDTVFVSGGRRGLEAEVRPQDLLDVTGGRTAAIAQ